MKKCLSLLLTVLLCLSASACAGKSEPPASSSGSSDITSSQPPEGAPAVEMDLSDRLMEEGVTGGGPFSGRLPDTETPQLICKDETARRLALAVRPLLAAGVQNLPFFDSDHPVDPAAAIRIAVLNTEPTDLGEGSYGPEGYQSEKYPDHPVTRLLDQLWKDGESPTDVLYADDVAATLERLFGITDWTHQSAVSIGYFPEEGVYIMKGLWVRRTPYPQLLSWEETENGYTCEVFLTDGFFGTIGDSIVLTEDNVQEMAAREAHYAFTFDMTSGEPVVTSFAQTQESLAQQAERLVDDYLWSSTPKAQAVGMIDTAQLYERIPQYQYENGTLEPLENSDHYPVAANGRVFGIFMDMRDPELGGSQSFSSEYADQLNAFTEQNDQICIVYDGMKMYLASPTDHMLVYDLGDEPARAGSFEETRPSLDGLALWNAKQRVILGGLYFDPETWMENRDSVPQSWKDAASGTDSPLDKLLSTYYRRPDKAVEVPDPEFTAFFGAGARIDEDKLIPTFWTDTEGQEGLSDLCRKAKSGGHIHDLLQEESWYAIVTDAAGTELGYAMVDKGDFKVGEYGSLGDSRERRYFRSDDAVEKLLAEGGLDADRGKMTYCVIRSFSLGTLLCDGEREYFIPSMESIRSIGLVETGKVYPLSELADIMEKNMSAIFPTNQVDEHGNPYTM